MALTAERSTLSTGTLSTPIVLPVKASTKVYRGAMVAKDASGWALGCTGVSTQIPIGRAKYTVDNSTGANGAKSVEVETGTFAWTLDGTNPPGAAQVGKVVYAKSDDTVSSSSADGPPCGLLSRLESGQAFVDMTTTQSSAEAAADSDLESLALSTGSALVGHGASTVSFKLDTLSTADVNAAAALAASTGALLIGVSGGSTVQAELNGILATIEDAILGNQAIRNRFITRDEALTFTSLAAVSSTVHDINVDAPIPATGTLFGWTVQANPAFAASTANITAQIGLGSDPDAIASGIDLTSTAQQKGTSGVLGFQGAYVGGEQVTFTITSEGPLSAVSVGDLSVAVYAIDMT